MRTMLRLAAERDELRVVADQIGSPTSAALIADATARILGKGDTPSGVWHLTASGETSWHGFAEAIISGAHARGLLARAPRVVPIATSDYPTPARRPAYSRLDLGRIEVDFDVKLAEWRVALSRVLDSMRLTVSS